MTKQCLWCGTDILDHTESTVFIGRFIHHKCLSIMKRKLKKEGWKQDGAASNTKVSDER